MSSPKYRKDIDGLRAIAVLAVVFFHAFPKLVPGGFVGVDVFFIISGFLISTIIFTDLKNNRFSFKDFYIRRTKRIFPALILVLLFCFGLGWIGLFSNEFQQLGLHVFGGSTFSSNFILWKEAGYFDNSAESKPLLHLWSLAIEEQFYLFWPFLLWIASLRKWNWLKLTSLVVTVSFLFNVKKVAANPVAVFYLPGTRIWELLLGGLLAHTSLYHQHWLKGYSNLKSALGFILIFVGIALIDRNKQFPGAWALLPTLGAMLVISAGESAWLNQILLSNRFMVMIGLVSYPLYLWHWPIFSFIRIFESSEPSHSLIMAGLVVSIVLSFLTYQFIEKKIRFSTLRGGIVVLLLTVLASTGLLGWVTYQNTGFQGRNANAITLSSAYKNLQRPEHTRISDQSCEKLGIKTLHGEACISQSSNPSIMILGDSHAMALNSAVVDHRTALNTILVAAGRCLPFENYLSIGPTDSPADLICNKMVAHAFELLKNLKSIHTVVLASRGPIYFSGVPFGVEADEAARHDWRIIPSNHEEKISNADAFIKGYSELISKIRLMGKKVVFVIDPPELGLDPPTCVVVRPITFTKKTLNPCTVPRKVVDERNGTYRELVAQIQRRNPSFKVFDSHPIFCDEAFCYGKKNDQLYYFDHDHLSLTGSELLLRSLKSSL